MDSALAYVALNLTPRIGPVKVRRLLEQLGSVEAIFGASSRDLQSVEGIGPESAEALRNGAAVERARQELEACATRNLTVLHWDHPDYPGLLQEIYDPPLVLYVDGVVPKKWPAGIGVVGSRAMTHYGQEMARKFGYQLAYAGVPVVSGLARGIDTAAHQGALAARAVTWAVLGCGLDQIYPPENAELAARIREKGCLISEFPLGTQPDRQTFPMRNRIVSGLSFGVLVVEAGLESGALITARQALEQGRQVFAIPGRIDSPHALGSNRLIQEGAKLVTDSNDILQDLDMLFTPSQLGTAKTVPAGLNAEELQVLQVIGDDEMPIDRIIGKSGLPSSVVSSTLLRLEMKKLLQQLPGKIFVRMH